MTTLSPTQRKDHRLDRSSEAELRAIRVLNLDKVRRYPAIDYNPRSFRVQVIQSALPLWPNRFDLCRATSKVTRMIHDFGNVRIAHSINQALRLLQQPLAKKPTTATTASGSERAA
ncbi:MAG: hypothetical protein LAO76_26385 [Acidobacteriia bacterium]|nr:hypothetical protein [Terriglobia bacterium]